MIAPLVLAYLMALHNILRVATSRYCYNYIALFKEVFELL